VRRCQTRAAAQQEARPLLLQVGTLSKAFGALGGFVACSSAFKRLLSNRGRSVVYSTALPLPVVAAALAAIEVSGGGGGGGAARRQWPRRPAARMSAAAPGAEAAAPLPRWPRPLTGPHCARSQVSYREAWRRRHLEGLVRKLGDAMGVPAHSPVVPLVVGSEEAAVALSNRLLRLGFHVPAIRPPTVPAGTCRLRVSLSAAHSEADVDALVAAVQASGAVLQPLEHLLQAEQVYAAASGPRQRGSQRPRTQLSSKL
jgi:8-amino-7-oxononanoate synthase